MKNYFLVNSLFLVFFLFTIIGCNKAPVPGESPLADNPLVAPYDTPFGIAPFDKIKDEHFKPALEEGFRLQKEEIEAIASNTEAPTFENTIEALDYSGALLTRVNRVFSNYTSANSNDTLDILSKEMSPRFEKLADETYMNPQLFERVKTVYEQRDRIELSTEQRTLLEDTYKGFVRRGVNLPEDVQTKISEMNERIAALKEAFTIAIKKDTAASTVIVTKQDDLAGIPKNLVDAAAEKATAAGKEGEWHFAVNQSSTYTFLTFSANRSLREKVHNAYISIGNNNNEFNTKEIVAEILNLRIERAKLYGYPLHADYILEDRMAKTPANVKVLLKKVWDFALVAAKKEVTELQKIIDGDGDGFKLKHWDWWYYAERLKKAEYGLDQEELSKHFELQASLKGAFDVINKLWGLTFKELTNVPKYHPDIQVFEVKEANGDHVGILIMDFFARPGSKGDGAWMSSFRKQSKKDGKFIHPIITNVFNFAKPVGGEPALLTPSNVITLYHELGHGLHGLLSNCTYPGLSGTSVKRDFVELPSQILENWAMEPQVLKSYAVNVETGKPISDELIEQMEKAGNFNAGFDTVQYMSAVYLDLALHMIDEPTITKDDIGPLEDKAMAEIGLIPEIIVRYKTPYFRHIFSSAYDVGYYSYIWAEIFDADAYEAFTETGDIFNKALALSFRQNILERGGTDDNMEMYKRFRGFEPDADSLLRRRGFIE